MDNKVPVHVVAVSAIVKRGEEYLIARRSLNDDQKPGEWSFPGGKVEEGEIGVGIIESSLRREVLEEVGVEITDKIDFVSGDVGFWV